MNRLDNELLGRDSRVPLDRGCRGGRRVPRWQSGQERARSHSVRYRGGLYVAIMVDRVLSTAVSHGTTGNRGMILFVQGWQHC